MAAPGLGTDFFRIQNEAGENTAATRPAWERRHSSPPAAGPRRRRPQDEGPGAAALSHVSVKEERELVLQKRGCSTEPMGDLVVA